MQTFARSSQDLLRRAIKEADALMLIEEVKEQLFTGNIMSLCFEIRNKILSYLTSCKPLVS